MWLSVINLVMVLVIAAVGVMHGVAVRQRIDEAQRAIAEQSKQQTEQTKKLSTDISTRDAASQQRASELSGRVDALSTRMDADATKSAASMDALHQTTSDLSNLVQRAQTTADEARGPRDQTFTGWAYVRLLDVGAHDDQRQPQAGTVGYRILSDALDVVGASAHAQDQKTRKVRIWDQLRTDRLQLGEKWSLSGTTPGEWLTLADKDGAEAPGGFSAKRLRATSDASFAGGRSDLNPTGLPTLLPSAEDGKNYLRGDTELTGNLNAAGDVRSARSLCVQGSCLSRVDVDRVKSTNPTCRDAMTAPDPSATVAGGLSSLSRLMIVCNPDERVSAFRLETQGTGPAATVGYRFRCCK